MKRWTFFSFSAICILSAGTAVRGGNPVFNRGDSNLDGALDVSDPIQTLGFLFLGA
jgi:hypothetical protein